MRRFESIFPAFLITLLITGLLPISGHSQSGRGRPRVPTRAPTTEAPPPKVPEGAAVVKQDQAGSNSRFVLRNGMTVIISEQHAAPITAAVACFKVGYRDEPSDTPGIARLLERVILRSAVERVAAPSALDPRSLGDLIGADTGFESTSYYAVAHPSRIKELLAFQAEMILEPAIPADQLQREIADLIEEDKWNSGIPAVYEPQDRPTRYNEPAEYAMGRLLELASGRSLSRGFKRIQADALRTITREQIGDFHRAQYRPGNLVIAVAGDVSTFGTLVEIQQRYGEFGVTRPTGQPEADNTKAGIKSGTPVSKPPPTRLPGGTTPSPKPAVAAPVSPPAPEEPKLRYSAARGDLTQSIVTVGFQVPGADSADWPALEVLSALIGQGRGSRLARSLLEGQPALSRAQSEYLKFKDGGLLTAQIWVDPAGIDKAESTLFKELDRLRREQAGLPELSRAQTLLERRFVERSATYLGRARALAQAEAQGASYRTAVDYRNRIRAVRAEDVQRAAAKYLSTAAASVHEYEPQSAMPRSFDPERFAATIAAWAPSFSQPVNSTDVRQADVTSESPMSQGPERTSAEQATFESIEPLALRDFSTLNGPRAFVREDHSLPLVTIALLFQGGRVIEDEKTSGMTELMLRSMLYGTARQTAVRIADQLEQLGAEVDVVNEPDFFGILVSVLSRNADRALHVARDIVEEPAFRDEDVSRARKAQESMIRASRDSASARSSELFLQSLYSGHPYSLSPHGREDVLAKANGEQMRAWHERTIKRQVPLAIIVGDTDGSALISGQIAEGFRRRELDKTIQLRIPQPAKQAERVEQRISQLSTAVVGWAGPKGDSPDLPVLEIIESVLNRPGGRLLSQSKEKPNFAYFARIEHQALLTSGAIFFELTTSPESETRARALLGSEIDRLARSGVTAEQLSAGIAASSASRLTEMQSPSARVLEYADALFHQRPPAEVDALAERLSSVTMEDVKRVAALYFKSASLSSGIVRGASTTTAK